MSLGRILKGSTGPAWTVQVLKADNSPLVITGATITGIMYDREGTGTGITLSNSYSITSGANGQFTYTPQASDVAAYGVYDIYWTVTVGGLAYVVADSIEIAKVP